MSAINEITVVVCTYSDERWSDLISALSSIQGQTRQPDEIIVVVDHNDSLRERLLSLYPTVRVLPNMGPHGLSGARNTGVAEACGEVIAFLDDDAIANRDWLEVLLANYTDENVLGVGGSALPEWEGGRPGWFPTEFDWVVGCTYRGMPTKLTRVRNPIGCNMSLRRSVFEVVGGFQTGIGRVGTLPVGCEETELSIRGSQHFKDGRFLYQPTAEVHHRVRKSRGSFQYFISRCYAEGLSKALVSRLVGSNDTLSSERSYTLKTLPRGVAAALGSGILNRDLGDCKRALAIVTGLLVTVVGYGRGQVAMVRGLELDRPPRIDRRVLRSNMPVDTA